MDMKKSFVLCLLISALVLTAGYSSAQNHKADINNLNFPRLGPSESFSYTYHLERGKNYEQLLSLLKKELAAIQIMEIWAKSGIDLTETEKTIITQQFAEKGSKDPVKDFLKRRQLTPEYEDYDIEGKLFILDDIADIYTYGVSDFRRAQEYNDKAERIFEKIRKTGINQSPVSDYYNQRRLLYYFAHLNNKDIKISQSLISQIRLLDFEGVGARIKARKDFLKLKLGIENRPDMQAVKEDSSSIKLLDHLHSFAKQTGVYDEFNANRILAAEAYRDFRSTNDINYLKKIIKYGEKALERIPVKSISSLNSVNLLHYWLGISYIKLGSSKQGIKHMEEFLAGIDELDRLGVDADNERRNLVAKVNKESQEEIKYLEEKQQTVRESEPEMFEDDEDGPKRAPSKKSSPAQMIKQIMQKSFEISRMHIEMIAYARQSSVAIRTEQNLIRLKDELSIQLTAYYLKLNRYLDRFEMADYFFELGKAYEAEGLKDKAFTHYAEASSIIEQQRSSILTEQQRIIFFETKTELHERIISLLVSLNKPDTALEYVERSKSRAFVDILGNTRLNLKSREQTDRYSNIITAQEEEDDFLNNRNITSEQINEFAKRSSRGVTIKGLMSKPALDKEDIEILSISSVLPIASDEIKKIVPPGTTLLEYYLTSDRVYCFIVNSENISVASVPVNIREVRATVDKLRENITNRGEGSELLKYFYSLLIQPVEDRIKGDELIIVPHGVLHYIPFQALFDGRQYLIERFAISYSPSITVLKLTEGRDSIGNKKALVVGNPTLDLKFAEEEAVNVSKLLPGSTLLTRDKAAKSFVKENGSNYDYIHVAAHGIYDEQTPLNSRILFTGGDKTIGGALTAAELFSTRWNASLVTLSACESGLSKNKSGDELIGLQRGIFFAGTRSMISSLWGVDDRATSVLMDVFYKNLAGMSKSKSLQKSQIETMKQFQHPFFWSAFNLFGTRK